MARPRRAGWPFVACSGFDCSGCDNSVVRGERIVRMDDGTYRHIGACEKARCRNIP